MAATLSYSLTDICEADNHATLHIDFNGQEIATRRIGKEDLAQLTAEEREEVAWKLFLFAIQRKGVAITGAAQLQALLPGRVIELDVL